LLVRRWRRAKDTLALAEQSFNQAMSASAGNHNFLSYSYMCIIVNAFVLGGIHLVQGHV